MSSKHCSPTSRRKHPSTPAASCKDRDENPSLLHRSVFSSSPSCKPADSMSRSNTLASKTQKCGVDWTRQEGQRAVAHTSTRNPKPYLLLRRGSFEAPSGPDRPRPSVNTTATRKRALAASTHRSPCLYLHCPLLEDAPIDAGARAERIQDQQRHVICGYHPSSASQPYPNPNPCSTFRWRVWLVLGSCPSP